MIMYNTELFRLQPSDCNKTSLAIVTEWMTTMDCGRIHTVVGIIFGETALINETQRIAVIHNTNMFAVYDGKQSYNGAPERK